MRRFFLLLFLMLNFVILNQIQAQQVQTLTYEDAINIALKRSYTVKSFQETKLAMQYFYNYNKAMFKPRLDFGLFMPAWNENVILVQDPQGLPVYNSFGDMRFNGNLQFTYMLPTGGFFRLSSQMDRFDQKGVYPLLDYLELKTRQSMTSLSISFNQPIFTKNVLRESLNEAKYSYEQISCQFTRGQMNIIYNVTSGFYFLYHATRQVEISRERLKN